MSESELSRIVKLRQIDARPMRIEADAEERAALAERFGIVSVERLAADVTLEREGEEVAVSGRLEANIVQTCGISGEDFPVRIDEPIALRFVPEVARSVPDEEIELEESELDEIEYSGDAFDLGEAVAQSLGLAIDPYATGPNADVARKEAGILEEGAAGPLAEALRALKKD
ncbi:YceD family protein [Pelagerythrobacter rhizovicinus]|uniref:DUF177 domain-containing protein n=1 Tax=Pelagerythrobacter rhizovicinus TaxID=2268576 RepID=A0A4Q2KMR8_9SPHN|nr:YceD family protein [Pelagerythrobacter rhizovicinus]RXZ65560.1 DUF177 domain-containing protein [Pelagerythrobacter rhizovicinus]